MKIFIHLTYSPAKWKVLFRILECRIIYIQGMNPLDLDGINLELQKH